MNTLFIENLLSVEVNLLESALDIIIVKVSSLISQ